MKYKHLSEEERILIAVLYGIGHSIRYIADKLKRHPCTIRNEIARNSGARGYDAQAAQGKYERKRSEANAMPYKSDMPVCGTPCFRQRCRRCATTR